MENKAHALAAGIFVALLSALVLGLASIQLSDEGKPAPRLAPNDEVPPRIPLHPGLLARLEEKGEVILERVDEVTRRVNTLLSDPNQQRIANALENISQAASGTQKL